MAKITGIEVYYAIKEHVAGGGWLGAAWPEYLLEDREWTQNALDQGYQLALIEGFIKLSGENWELAYEEATIGVNHD